MDETKKEIKKELNNKDLTKEEKGFIITVFNQMTFNNRQEKALQLNKSVVTKLTESLEKK